MLIHRYIISIYALIDIIPIRAVIVQSAPFIMFIVIDVTL